MQCRQTPENAAYLYILKGDFMQSTSDNLGTEPVGRLLFKLALPAIISQLVNMLYNIIDRIYIGHIPENGVLALTGLGLCFPVIILISLGLNMFISTQGLAAKAMIILSSISQLVILPLQGITQGAQPIISFNYGAQNMSQVKQTVRLLIMVCANFSFSCCILIECFPTVFIHIFNNKDELVSMASRALRVYCLGIGQ